MDISRFGHLWLKESLVTLSAKKDAAHGYRNQAQEKPPEEEQDEDSAPVPPPDSDTLLEKDDICLQVSWAPHEGHTQSRSFSEPNINCSKTWPHSLHLYS